MPSSAPIEGAGAGRPMVRVARLSHGRGLPLPARATAGAAGLDLVAAVVNGKPVVIPPGGRAAIPTGFALAVPEGWEVQIRPRSGLALRHGVTVLNSPGTIDCDYRGEVMVILVNLGDEPFAIRRGERIAQIVVAPLAEPRLVEAELLEETARGAGGFGSTGSGVRVGGGEE